MKAGLMQYSRIEDILKIKDCASFYLEICLNTRIDSSEAQAPKSDV